MFSVFKLPDKLKFIIVDFCPTATASAGDGRIFSFQLWGFCEVYRKGLGTSPLVCHHT